MSTLITTCPACRRTRSIDPMATRTTCRCGHKYNVWEDADEDPDEDDDPDYGGVFDGRTVTSDADPGL